MNQEFKEALERLDLITEELSKMRRAIIASSEGKPFNEAFNEEIYLENRQDEDKSYSHLCRMMEHLLKLKYCTNDRNHNLWINSVETHKSDVVDIIKWKSKKNKKTNYVKYLNTELQNIYEDSIEYYKDAAKKYPDLVDGIELIPEECPWTLEELMDESIDDLLEKLD